MSNRTPPRLGPPALSPALALDGAGVVAVFATELRRRGWRVTDSASDPADLLVAPDAATFAAARQTGVPAITALPPEAVAPWEGPPLVLLDGRIAALWRWWGPHRLYGDLLRGIEDAPVRRVVIGYNWTLVETSWGAGVAQTPAKAGGGCRSVDFVGRSLLELARMVEDLSDLRAAIGIAAINAFYNRPDLAGADVDGLAGITGRTVVIGRFPDLARKLPQATVIERQPGPEDLPEIAAEWLLPGAGAMVATASTLVNRSLPRLLERASAAKITLLGPGTPLTPRLHAYGIDRLAGFVLTDVAGAAQAIAGGAAAADLKPFGRRLTLSL